MECKETTPEMSLHGFRRRRPCCLATSKFGCRSLGLGSLLLRNNLYPLFYNRGKDSGEEERRAATQRIGSADSKDGRRRLIRAGPQAGQMFAQFDFLLDVDVRHFVAGSRAACKKRALNCFGEQLKGPVCKMQRGRS